MCFTYIIRLSFSQENLIRTVDRKGSQFSMYEIIKELPKVDDWEYDLVKALKSEAIQKKNIADSFNQWIRKYNVCGEG